MSSISSPHTNSNILKKSVIIDVCPDTSSYLDNSSSFENDDFSITKGPWTAEVKFLTVTVIINVCRRMLNLSCWSELTGQSAGLLFLEC
jgi:hypothetical protein